MNQSNRLELSIPSAGDKKMLSNPMEFPGLVVRKKAVVVLTLTRAPAFDPEASWTLYRDESQWFVRRITCAASAGHMGGSRIALDTYGAEASVETGEAEDLMAALYQIEVNPFPARRNELTLDGCRYGVHCGDSFASTDLEWWCKAPSEWAELRDWYANALALFQVRLPRSTIPIQAMHPWCE